MHSSLNSSTRAELSVTLPQIGIALQHHASMDAWLPFAELPVDAFEILLDNFIGPLDGPHLVWPGYLDALASLRNRFPFLAHSNFGGEKSFLPLEETLTVRRHVPLAKALEALWVSDHCFYGNNVGAENFTHPLQWSRAEVKRIAPRMRALQELYGMPLLHENPAYFFAPPGSDLSEAEFLARLVEEAGTYLHLDLHNIYANSINLPDYRCEDYLASIPLDRVISIHVAGGTTFGGFYHDSHDERAPEQVWEMLEQVLRAAKVRAVIIEYEQVLERRERGGVRERVLERREPGQARDMIIADLERAAEIWDKVYGLGTRHSHRQLANMPEESF